MEATRKSLLLTNVPPTDKKAKTAEMLAKLRALCSKIRLVDGKAAARMHKKTFATVMIVKG